MKHVLLSGHTTNTKSLLRMSELKNLCMRLLPVGFNPCTDKMNESLI